MDRNFVMQSIRLLIKKIAGNVYVQTALIQLFTLIILVMIWNSTHSPA